MEIGSLISFNMATAMQSQGCAYPNVAPPNASVFLEKLSSEQLDTDSWCEAIESFGGKYATLVAKHLCGFTLWPSSVTSGNFTYDYGVRDYDVVQRLAESCSARGIKLGLYYSVNVNAYLNVNQGKPVPLDTTNKTIVTQEQYNDIVLQHLTELWSNYGDLAEIWFDGGYDVPGLSDKLLNLLEEKQGNAAVFNGCGLTKNAVLWIGSETGHAPHYIWNAQNGCPPNGTLLFFCGVLNTGHSQTLTNQVVLVM